MAEEADEKHARFVAPSTWTEWPVSLFRKWMKDQGVTLVNVIDEPDGSRWVYIAGPEYCLEYLAVDLEGSTELEEISP